MDLKKPAILSISLLTVMTNAAVAPWLGLINQSFPEAGNTLIKQVVTIPSLMIIIFSIISGKLIKYLSKKTVLAIGLCVYLAGAFFARLSGSITELIIFRAMTGAGTGLIVPLATSLITDFYEGKERAQMIGYSTFTSYTGAALAPLLTGWFISSKWQNAFFIYSIALVVLIFTMIFIPFLPKKKMNDQKRTGLNINLKVIFLALIGCGIYIIFYLMPTDVSFLIQKIASAEQSSAASLLAIEIIAAASAGVLFSHFTHKHSSLAFPLGFGLMSLGFFIVFLSSTFFLLIISMIIIGMGIGTLRPLIYLRTSQVSPPENMTTAFAFVNSGFSLGQFISPFFYYGSASILSTNLVSGNYLTAAMVLLAACITASVLTIRSKLKTD